jgi:hypothetical protein
MLFDRVFFPLFIGAVFGAVASCCGCSLLWSCVVGGAFAVWAFFGFVGGFR